MKKFLTSTFLIKVSLLLILFFLYLIWTRGGFNTFFLDTDFGRDLSELSNFWIGRRVIWLGPRLSPGFNASPIYYYIFYPALWISNGNAYSLMISNLIIALLALGAFGLFGLRKWGAKVLIPVFLIGLTPWWRGVTMHPGNGYTYVFWLFLSLTLLWFEASLFLSAFFLGLSISYHPAAIFAILLLIYEWFRKGHSFGNLFLILLGLIIPWAPIILFEIITKGYTLRHWLVNPQTGINFQVVDIANIQQIFSLSGLPALLALAIWIFVGVKSTGRIRIWFFLSSILVVFFGVLSYVPQNYLLGISCILWFIAVVELVDMQWGLIIMIVLAILFLGRDIIMTKPPPLARRPISKIQNVVDALGATQKLDKHKKIAVVSALGKDTSVPQADDYHFFLRIKNYQVLDVQLYSQADVLVMFIEEPDFNWGKWSTWEIDQFGSKKLDYRMEAEGIKILIFNKR